MNQAGPSHGLLLLTGGVLIAGSLLLPFGTRDFQSKEHPEFQQRPSADASMAIIPKPERGQKGAFLQTMECAGCHDRVRREVGPSFRDIAQLYEGRPAELAAAISHPQPGWVDYPPGPERLPISENDRASLVSWILDAGGKRHD